MAPQAWLAVAIALAGTACLEGLIPGFGAATASGDGGALFNWGDAWCGGTAVGFGAMFARMEYHMDELDDAEAALPLTVWQLVAMLLATAGWFAQSTIGTAGAADGLSGWLASLQTLNAAEPLLLPAIAFMGLSTPRPASLPS